MHLHSAGGLEKGFQRSKMGSGKIRRNIVKSIIEFCDQLARVSDLSLDRAREIIAIIIPNSILDQMNL